MWSPAHVFLELAMVVGIGATGAGLIRFRWREGRIALVVGVSLLIVSVL